MDPTLEIIKACMDKMKSDPTITDFVGNRIYDRVPEKSNNDGTTYPVVVSPYISLGATSLITEDYDCLDSVVINIQWNIWSWGGEEAYSSTEVRKLAFAVRKCLHKKEINLTQNGFVDLQISLINYNRAADGITNQATLTFEALVDVK